MLNQVTRGIGHLTPLVLSWLAVAVPLGAQSLPPVQAPPQNPITAEKAVLGKILFWDEQLSANNRMACGTCHMPEAGGGDPRVAPHPGRDGRLGTPDDTFGSPGVRRANSSNDYIPDPLFRFGPQATPRTAPTAIASGYFRELLWDGAANTTFRDPVSGNVSIPIGGALENQLVRPIVSEREMGHDGRLWSEVLPKLEQVEPLALATSWPADVTAALQGVTDYAELFRRAFGDPAITAERVAFAIATYERTLVPDQSPWDRFVGGQPSALTPDQQAGRQLFFGIARCSQCHAGALFSDQSYRHIGLRPPFEDVGRQAVTGSPADAGRFKVPTLRNAALRSRFMHTGQFISLQQVVNFYNAPPPPRPGRDPLIAPIGLNPTQRNQLVAFLGALVDPRVANATGPFSRPTLYAERLPGAGDLYGPAGIGSGGRPPRMVAEVPTRIGLPDFRIGVHDALGDSFGALGLSFAAATPGSSVLGAPLHIDPATTYLVPTFLGGFGIGEGFATFRTPLPNDAGLIGMELFAQWFVADRGAPQGLATSSGARLTFL